MGFIDLKYCTEECYREVRTLSVMYMVSVQDWERVPKLLRICSAQYFWLSVALRPQKP